MPSNNDPSFVQRVIALSTYMTYGQIAAEVSTITRPITRNQIAGIVYRHTHRDPAKAEARAAFIQRREAEREAGAEARRQRDLERSRAYDEQRRARRAALRAESDRLKSKGLYVNLDGYHAERRQRLEALAGLEMRRVGLGDLQRRACRWIDGMPTGEHFYCGNETAKGSSYCPCHHAVAYDRIAKQAPNPQGFVNRRAMTGVWA